MTVHESHKKLSELIQNGFGEHELVFRPKSDNPTSYSINKYMPVDDPRYKNAIAAVHLEVPVVYVDARPFAPKRPEHYILNADGNPVAEPDLLKWAGWFSAAPRSRFHDNVAGRDVFTEFLGLDQATGNFLPVLWETTVCGGSFKDWSDRCSGGISEAKAMHTRMVELVRKEMSLHGEPGCGDS